MVHGAEDGMMPLIKSDKLNADERAMDEIERLVGVIFDYPRESLFLSLGSDARQIHQRRWDCESGLNFQLIASLTENSSQTVMPRNDLLDGKRECLRIEIAAEMQGK